MKEFCSTLAIAIVGTMALPAQANELNNWGDKEVICPLLEDLTAGLDTISDPQDLEMRDSSRWNNCGYHKRSQVVATNYLGWYETSSQGKAYYVRINHVVYATGVGGFRPEALYATDEWAFSSTCRTNSRFEWGARLFGIKNHEFMESCLKPTRKT